MRAIVTILALVAVAIAGNTKPNSGKGPNCFLLSNGNGGLLSLGNVALDALNDSCSGGDVYGCDNKNVKSGLVNLDLNAQYSPNHVL
ncbi:hypothetical protein N7532_002866 [Penicillium argentinense]|uniref:Hydrophobin n=1 Tax=Penicillium argentinense TaxID=1131581 RepID=A0A9W9KLL6_9EURO|nr:uncharacterized protein N7532_002866 [Penicillium argentinense]KAJ5110221.1 hypothetical protein N7532_002866 [Penicillium argentinense]